MRINDALAMWLQKTVQKDIDAGKVLACDKCRKLYPKDDSHECAPKLCDQCKEHPADLEFPDGAFCSACFALPSVAAGSPKLVTGRIRSRSAPTPSHEIWPEADEIEGD
jgi:hypothetical protein